MAIIVPLHDVADHACGNGSLALIFFQMKNHAITPPSVIEIS
jgi:hypothetical protein